MNVTNSVLAGNPVVKFEGNLTIDSVATAKPKIMAAMTGAIAIQLDLSAVRECDTAGVQLVLMTRAEAVKQGLAFSAPAPSGTFRTAVDRIGIPAHVFEHSSSGVADRD